MPEMHIRKVLNRYVLDTSAIMACINFGSGEYFTVPSVVGEIKKGKMRQWLNYMLDTKIKVMNCSSESRELVATVAEKMGDLLSKTDCDVLALAIDINAVVLTEDYSMQNVASALGLKFKSVLGSNIRERIVWKFQCKGCGKLFNKAHDSCPVCGAVLRRIPISRTCVVSSDTP